jgi:AmmeMemoRadiSam system protein A
MKNGFSDAEKKEMLSIARNAIADFLNTGSREYPSCSNKKYLELRGVFVTLHKDGDLRGCIGYPLPIKPLLEAIVDNAINAAVEDPRFNPVTITELPLLEIEISVLTVPQDVSSADQVEVGRDGIIITKGMMRGLLLPQVPLEQGWDREQYLSYGCVKAGLSSNEWKRGVKIETFQALVFNETDFNMP